MTETVASVADGLDRCAVLARVCLEYGDDNGAAAHLTHGIAELEPELRVLRAAVASPPPAPTHSLWGSCLLALLFPAVIAAAQVLLPEFRPVPFFPHVAVVCVVAMVSGFVPALFTIAASTLAGVYVISYDLTDAVSEPWLRGGLFVPVAVLIAYAVARPRLRALRLQPLARSAHAPTPVP